MWIRNQFHTYTQTKTTLSNFWLALVLINVVSNILYSLSFTSIYVKINYNWMGCLHCSYIPSPLIFSFSLIVSNSFLFFRFFFTFFVQFSASLSISLIFNPTVQFPCIPFWITNLTIKHLLKQWQTSLWNTTVCACLCVLVWLSQV